MAIYRGKYSYRYLHWDKSQPQKMSGDALRRNSLLGFYVLTWRQLYYRYSLH